MVRSRLGSRLAKLEPLLTPAGCATCRGWTWVLLVGEDGPHRPEQCPDCGRRVPITLEVQVVGVPIAAL